jgi:hypothetical protein
VTDLAASIAHRLRNHAAQNQQDYNAVLARFASERFLFRLSQSEHAKSFLLKGALLFLLWHDLPERPTRDIDLLGFGEEDLESIESIFREVCAIDASDAVVFEPASVRGVTIRKQAGYGGVRITLLGKLKNIQLHVQVDVGFGDAVTPAASEEVFPVVLADLPAPILRVYPKYTVCAEKLEAISALGMANTRLKDFYDMWLLLTAGDMDDDILGAAIAATFNRRKRPIGDEWPVGLTDEFAADPQRQRQWQAFLAKNGLAAPPLSDVLATLRNCLSVPLDKARK